VPKTLSEENQIIYRCSIQEIRQEAQGNQIIYRCSIQEMHRSKINVQGMGGLVRNKKKESVGQKLIPDGKHKRNVRTA
jgi:hypothetical protein